MIYGTNALDIRPGMHSIKLPPESLAFPPSLFWNPFHPAKVMHSERCTIIPAHPQANEPPALWHSSTLTWLDLCLLSHAHALNMFLPSSMTSPVTRLLHSSITKMPLHSILRLWFPGLRPLLVTHLPLYVRTMGGNLWLESYNHSSRPKESLTRPLFHIHPSKMVMQRGSTELY